MSRVGAPSLSAAKAGFALPSVLFVVAMVTLVFLVAIEALTSLAVETRQAMAATRFQAVAMSTEADVAFEGAVLPLGPRAVMRSALPSAERAARARRRRPTPPAPPDDGVGLQDEAGLINFDDLSVGQRAQLFAVMGVARAEQAPMADRLADYVDPDDLRRPDGAERDDYARAGLPPPPNTDLARRDQVEGLLGWGQMVGTERWRAFADNVTADPTSRVTNLNTATPAALETLFGLTPAQAQRALARRAQAPFTGVSDLGRSVGLLLPSDADLVYTMPNGRFALKIEDAPAGLRLASFAGDTVARRSADRPFWIVEPAISTLTTAERGVAARPCPGLSRPRRLSCSPPRAASRR